MPERSPQSRSASLLPAVDSEALLAALLNTAVDSIVVTDHDGTIGLFNPAAERMFGYGADEVVGSNVKMLMPADVAAHHDGYMSRYTGTGDPRIIGSGREVSGLRKDGSTFPMELAVSEFECRGRQCFTGVIRDVSARRVAERRDRQRLDELAHAGRLSVLGEMSSGIAHELNQPLAAIVGFAEACLRMQSSDTLDADTLRDALDQICAQGRRASGIVSRLRQLARKDAGTRLDVDLNALVRDVLVLYTHDPRLDSINLELSLCEQPARIVAVRTQMEQVVINLLQNALEALSDTGTPDASVHITTSADDQQVVFRIQDNGPGLPDPEIVFEGFFTGKRSGLGLGLTISRSIVEAHSGQLRALPSERGAAFEFWVPACNS